ncbi:ABC transporter ATP-binding protein [Diplocloster modestus]|uniref:ABC transporter ATP-binding protein n=1 Tax=Diplocloster modestus TaxID=2850322 RepID=A0ABS6K437_9FIRM|nr:ABC transporter ATP-binding protein [Diplocloster modestus]MBU9725235.1 ABC transporter ATP-binding protein [Diplocloster modestus]
MSEYIVEMRHITKKFPGIIANNDVTIQIKKGEIFALLGENGAGKSTLMSMLFGMYEPDEGEILIRGEKVKIASPNHATRLNIGMVHQHFKLVSNYTVTENIVMGMEPVKKLLGFIPYVDLKKAAREIAQLSAKYGLEVDPQQLIENANVSTQQRVEILKMLYREAEILIFDEPTAVLTPQEIEFLLDIIRGLRDGGKTVILISHKLEEIKQVSDRCAILNRGKLVTVRDVAATSTKEMANLMVGREVSFETDKKPADFHEKILEVEHLSVEDQNHFPLVKDVSFSVRGGEIFAIAGVSGNGQVELADAIAGLIKARSGVIRLNGVDISDYSIRRRTLEGISYIPEDRQNYGLVLDFTLAENLALKQYYQEPFSHKGVLRPGEMDRYGERMLEKYDIRSGQGVKTQVRSMSGGNQQKAIVGREIELQSPLMIFVQPTRGLDIGAIENIHNQILKERDAGKAILLISLELDEIMNLSDTIGVIYNGAIMKIADAKTLTTNEVGEFMMGVKGA